MQRIVGIAFVALAVFLAWMIVADARDLASGAEARLVRINPSELERTDPQREAIWHETSSTSSTASSPSWSRFSGGT